MEVRPTRRESFNCYSLFLVLFLTFKCGVSWLGSVVLSCLNPETESCPRSMLHRNLHNSCFTLAVFKCVKCFAVCEGVQQLMCTAVSSYVDYGMLFPLFKCGVSFNSCFHSLLFDCVSACFLPLYKQQSCCVSVCVYLFHRLSSLSMLLVLSGGVA